jgi:cytochrome bd-type quinol oxidase subunit 2
MDADATRNPAIMAMARGSWLVLGGITLAAMALAMLALDDITTDNAAQFPVEYRILAICAVWLLCVAWPLWRSGSRRNAALILASLAVATSLCAGGIGHKRDGGWAAFWPQYIALLWAWIHGTVVGILMIRRGFRPNP